MASPSQSQKKRPNRGLPAGWMLSPAGFLYGATLALAACAGSRASPLPSTLPPTASPSVSPSAVVLAVSPSPIPTSTIGVMQTEQVKIVAVGDVMLGRMVNKTSVEQGDFGWPFAATRDILSAADVTVGNLEAPLIPDCELKGIGLRLCADSRAVEGLSGAGFDVLGLANNHALDYGPEGRQATLDALRGAGMDAAYDGSPVALQRSGLTIGLLAYDDHDRTLDIERAQRETAELASRVDFVIGLLHWGYEYRPNPSERQQELAHALIDAGMRLIVGSHPHWLQPVEEYGGGLIFYSLGNFVFDQTWSPETRSSVIALISVSRPSGALDLSYRFVPIEIAGYGQPQPITPAAP